MANEIQKIERVSRILIEKTADLEEDEREACLRIWKAVARRRKIRGKPESWASGVYYTYCRMILKEGVIRKSVEKRFNVSEGTFTRKCTEIRKLLNLSLFDKRYTPSRIYAKSPFAELEEALRLIDDEEPVTSYFEVKEKGRSGILLVDLKDGREYHAKGEAALQKLKVGQMVHMTLHPQVDAYVSSRVMEIFDPEDAKHKAFIESVKDYYSGRYIEKALEMQRNMCEACKEYFGSTDPVFYDPREAEEALNAFMRWFSYERETPGKGKTPAAAYLEDHGHLPEMPMMKLPRELLEVEEVDVGLVFDEIGGMYILPHYGEVKELLHGDFRKVPDYRGLVRTLVTEEGFIPPFLIRKMINGNPKQAVEVFATSYKKVKTLGDVFKLFEENRSDWKKEPTPSIIPIRY
ncbi:MAG: DUF6398 domain-containing protein [Candidatus Bathyarchaeia archaeon]